MNNSTSGTIHKMKVDNERPINYTLALGNELININKLIGIPIKFEFNGQINCIACGKKIKKSFNQGFCYQCMQTSPLADESIIRPELSMAQFGVARDLEWAQTHDLIDHYVYLSATSDIKVGVTRHHQIPIRWIDQGASHALIIAKAPNRHIAGIIETTLKQHFPDKTNWRKMLLGESNSAEELLEQKSKLRDFLHPELQQYLLKDEAVVELNYPIAKYPNQITSINFDKQATIEGTLEGIKGQYLYFEDSKVLNIRRHTGYYINLQY